MEERISQLLKGTQFFDFGKVVFASNQPDHVCLLEVKNENDESFTILYDKNNNFLNINKRNTDNDHVSDIRKDNINLTPEQRQEIIQLLEQSKNNIKE